MMKQYRNVEKVLVSQATLEGAGVKLNRAFGFFEAPDYDPFLLLDDFHSDHPDDYIKGFPWHPHRGIETITYLIRGVIEHGDSLGNKGMIRSGDVQWMTAGSGIIHQEMPQITEDKILQGFQLWLNLPSAHKMMPPRYRDVTSDQIPELKRQNGVTVKVISGNIETVDGPIRDVVAAPLLFDVSIFADQSFEYDLPETDTLLCYVFSGEGMFDPDTRDTIQEKHLVVYGAGKGLKVKAGACGLRFLMMSGKPLNEPVAWRGPIVMNTDEELDTAFQEYRDERFIKHEFV